MANFIKHLGQNLHFYRNVALSVYSGYASMGVDNPEKSFRKFAIGGLNYNLCLNVGNKPKCFNLDSIE